MKGPNKKKDSNKKPELIEFAATDLLEMSESNFKQLKWVVGRFTMAFTEQNRLNSNPDDDPVLLFDGEYFRQTGFEPSDALVQIDGVMSELKTRRYISDYGPFCVSGNSVNSERTFCLGCGTADGLNKEGFYRLHKEICKTVKEKGAVERQPAKFDWVIKRTSTGGYTYGATPMSIASGTNPQRVLDALIEVADERGFASFMDIEKHMVKLGSEIKANDKERRTRISHGIDKGQGFLRHAKVGSAQRRLQDFLGESQIIKNLPGKGYQLLNPSNT